MLESGCQGSSRSLSGRHHDKPSDHSSYQGLALRVTKVDVRARYECAYAQRCIILRVQKIMRLHNAVPIGFQVRMEHTFNIIRAPP